jgi:hypothetical protein
MRSGTADMADTLPGILAIFNNVASGREAEFEEWFQHEHLAERIAVPGFLIGRYDPDGVSSHLPAWCHAGYGRGNRTVWRTPG